MHQQCVCAECRAERELRSRSDQYHHFTFNGSAGRGLVEQLIADLKTIDPNHHSTAFIPEPSSLPSRREAVIIMHATGLISVATGFNIGAVDFPELLALKVLRGGPRDD